MTLRRLSVLAGGWALVAGALLRPRRAAPHNLAMISLTRARPNHLAIRCTASTPPRASLHTHDFRPRCPSA